MRVSLIAVGRMKDGPERALAARYLERARAMGKPLGLTGFEVRECAESRAGSSAARKSEEAAAITAVAADGGVLIVLDERGTEQTSPDFAHALGAWRDGGRKALTLVIGGADGIDADLRARAERVLRFSKLTWPHQLVRIMAAEQLYRATTILSGHPYHRG